MVRIEAPEHPNVHVYMLLVSDWVMEYCPLQRTYNVTSMSFTPAELAASIRKFIPGFEMRCIPDFRNDIALSWPVSIDDTRARADWGWNPKYDIDVSTLSQVYLHHVTCSIICYLMVRCSCSRSHLFIGS